MKKFTLDVQKEHFEYKIETCFNALDPCQHSIFQNVIEVRRIDQSENTSLFALFGLLLIPIIGIIIWSRQVNDVFHVTRKI